MVMAAALVALQRLRHLVEADATVAIAVERGGMSEADAKTFVADLKKTGRYQADVY